MHGAKDPDHDPYQNVTDPEHWSKLKRTDSGSQTNEDPGGSESGSGSWSDF